ncbi:RidA family protein [Actinosynnema sp. NPDC053489]|uniref:RidA family protein n=1 Tax=Actinosynnema sp. NPDC053489 TaxID=3363916 RepID=UPI0037C720D2
MLTRTNPAGLFAAPELISQSVAVPGLVFLSGQVAWNADGELVGAGDHAAQAEQVARNIDIALAAAGTDRAHVVKETVYVVDHAPELVPAILGPLRAGVPAPPASTLVGVAALFQPGFLVEVDVVAVVPDRA